jgi:hypothetical protein
MLLIELTLGRAARFGILLRGLLSRGLHDMTDPAQAANAGMREYREDGSSRRQAKGRAAAAQPRPPFLLA